MQMRRSGLSQTSRSFNSPLESARRGCQTARTANVHFPVHSPGSLPTIASGSERRFDQLRLDSATVGPKGWNHGVYGNDHRLTVREASDDWESAWNERHHLNEHLHRVVRPPTNGSPRGGRPSRLKIEGSQFPAINRRLTGEILGQTLSRDCPTGHRNTSGRAHAPQTHATFSPEGPFFDWAVKHTKPHPPGNAPQLVHRIYGQVCPPRLHRGRDTRDALIAHWTNAPTVLSNCSV